MFERFRTFRRLLPSLIALAFGAGVLHARSGGETIDLGQGVTIEFVLIQPGTFRMGSESGDYDERPAHNVTLTKPYWLGKYEITQEQWEQVMGNNPSYFKGPKLPVENVSWEEAQRFVLALGKKAGRTFALPTEAQWEYACRAGTTTRYSCGDDPAGLDEYAWHSGNSELKTHPVGQKKPNPWGLYDMHGNVFEWCADWYSESYPDGDAVDPTGAAEGDRRVVRGGAWLYVLDNLRSADRGFSPPEYRVNEYGLRCVLLADAPSPAPDSSVLSGTAAETPPLGVPPKDSLAPQFQAIAAAVAASNRLSAEYLLAEAEKIAPNDPRLISLRNGVAGLPAPEETLTLELAPSLAIDFVLIRPGSFTMGSDESPILNEKPAHRVSITRPFYLGKFEVTQRQWVTVMGRNLSAFKGTPPQFDASQLPVENVSWMLCQSFLKELGKRFPEYTFRLPTEAEWEYACRCGESGEFRFPGGASLQDYAWFGSNAQGRTQPVGTRKPNAWGLFDMYGNVWEWCQDSFGPYRPEAQVDPKGPEHSPDGSRVARGGAWNNLENHVTPTFRHDVGADVVLRYYGFRCVAIPRNFYAKDVP